MQYIKEISINEAIIHVLDRESEEPILNEFFLDLGEETYNYLLKHIQRSLNDEDLKYAVFNEDRNIIKDLAYEYLNGQDGLLNVSKELSKQMYKLMKSNGSIPSCDFIIVSFSTEYGVMLGILKMDYVKNYIHSIGFVDDKLGISIVPQNTGLPGSGQKIQKCAFIKVPKEGQEFDLMVIDKITVKKAGDDYGANYFINNYLGCSIIKNERDMTKGLVNAVEKWARGNEELKPADSLEIRNKLKKKLKEEDCIEIQELSNDLFNESQDTKEHFENFVKEQGIPESINVDKEWLDKRMKRVRLKVDRDIDLYIDEETYADSSRFEVVRNGDGSVNILIKHVNNFIEK